MFLSREKRKHATGELYLKNPVSDQKPKHWTKLHQLLHDDRGLRYFFAALGIIIATGCGLLALLAQYKDPIIADLPFVKKTAPQPQKFYSTLTGLEVPDEATSKRIVTAIMIENSPDARPQSGLKNSGVVFEAIAEGGITRFQVLFQEQQPTLIGPVRSLRPYYLEWAAPFDASIAHIGGSYNALNEVRNGQYRDIDQFFNAGTYWRASDRYAPHNVYTSFERLNALNGSKGWHTSSFAGFPRVAADQSKKPKSSGLAAASHIQVNISSGAYNSAYSYDGANKVYIRSQGGAPHVDREAGQITPSVVIVMKVATNIGFEDGYREQMQTIGDGEGYIFQNGTVQGIRWNKAGKKNQLRFVDGNGKDIPLERGQTWITAIPTTKGVAWQ